MSINQSAINNLRNVLADLYIDEASTRRMALDIGLDTSRIEFGSRAINNWHTVLNEALKHNLVDVLIKAVLQEYPNSNALKDAVELFVVEKEKPEQFAEKVHRFDQVEQEITAKVVLPSPKQLEQRLVSINSLDRLEEYRSNQNIWLACAGLFIGAILGNLINWANGGQVTLSGWILMGVFFFITCIFIYFFHTDSKRANRIKDEIFHIEK